MMLNFLPQGPSMQFLGRFAAGFSAPNALLMLMMRALIPASGTPPTTWRPLFGFWKGGVGQNGAHDAFRGGGLGHWKSSPVVGISCKNTSPEAERPQERPARNGGPMKRGRRHGRLPHSRLWPAAATWGVARFKSLRLRPPTPEAYGKTADFGTLCIPGSSQRLDPSAALLSSSDRSRLAALNIMLTPCPVP